MFALAPALLSTFALRSVIVSATVADRCASFPSVWDRAAPSRVSPRHSERKLHSMAPFIAYELSLQLVRELGPIATKVARLVPLAVIKG